MLRCPLELPGRGESPGGVPGRDERQHDPDGQDQRDNDRHDDENYGRSVHGGHRSWLEKICRTNRNTFSTSRKIEAASSGAAVVSSGR
jgi:hypothetical protein